jgi:hypothetical protein
VPPTGEEVLRLLSRLCTESDVSKYEVLLGDFLSHSGLGGSVHDGLIACLLQSKARVVKQLEACDALFREGPMQVKFDEHQFIHELSEEFLDEADESPIESSS